MNPITRIVCNDFKAGPPEYALERPTLLVGPNGSGKSRAIQALRYALSGEVPTNKPEGGTALDSVARCFGPRGGTVEVYEFGGHWIQRGVSIDAEKAKVSEILTTSDTKEGAETPDLSRWGASAPVLNLKVLLGLSANDRREYVLQLCGSGAQAPELLSELATAYAKEGLGKIATAEMLDFGFHGRTDDGLPDLPKEEYEIIAAWIAKRGIRETVESYLVRGASVTEKCLAIGEAAKQERLRAGRAAKDATAALRELEAASKGAEAAAHDLTAKKAAVQAAEAFHLKAREFLAASTTARKAYDGAREAMDAAENTYAKLQDAPPPGPRPEAPAQDPRGQQYSEELRNAEGALSKALVALMAFDAEDAEVTRIGQELKDLRADRERLKASPLGKALQLLEDIPEGAHANVKPLKAALEAFSIDHRAQLSRVLEKGKKTQDAATALKGKFPSWEAERSRLLGEINRLGIALGEIRSRITVLKAEQASADPAAALKHWEGLDRQFREAGRLRASADASLAAAKAQLARATSALETIEENRGEVDYSQSESMLQRAKFALEQAEKAAGAVKAYRDAKESAESNRVLERCWKVCEAALKDVRERLVGEATKPLLDVMQQVLDGAQRPERVYLDLENDRGKAIFDFGWIRGKERIALEALSDGEAAIFGAALSIAIALKSPGRRIVALEADTLSAPNLSALLEAVGPWAEELDALLVATCHLPSAAPVAWTVIDLDLARK